MIQNDPPTISLKRIDPLDIADVFLCVEKSFNIHFDENEFENVATFGEICDTITRKIKLQEVSDCTSQQAFYKVRTALSKILILEPTEITPATKLARILPWKNRRKVIALFEYELGLSTDVIGPKLWMTLAAILGSIVGFILLFSHWEYGIMVLFSSIGAFILLNRFGKWLLIKTIGELAEGMALEHNLKSRRNPATFNKTEVEQVVRKLFSNALGLEESLFVRAARFTA